MKLNQIPEVMLEKKEEVKYWEDCTSTGNADDAYDHGMERGEVDGCNSALTAQGKVEVELDIGKIVDIIWEWAEEQGAIDKYGEITLSYEGQNVKDIAQALSDNLPKLLRRKR